MIAGGDCVQVFVGAQNLLISIFALLAMLLVAFWEEISMNKVYIHAYIFYVWFDDPFCIESLSFWSISVRI